MVTISDETFYNDNAWTMYKFPTLYKILLNKCKN